jgi:hypothetical protein
MSKFVVWLFWTVRYACRRTPRSLDEWLLKTERTWWPWKKCQPSVWHNDDGNQWHIYLTDEQSYTEPRTVRLDCHIGMESGSIVGFNVWDEVLRAAKEE